MISETDAEFVERIVNTKVMHIKPDEWPRVIALARRGAAVQWRPIEEDYEGEVLLWPRGSAVPSHFMPLPPPPAGETNER